MTLNLEAIKARCKAALCPECDGRGSVPDRPGYSVLCVCADGLSEDGEDMPVGRFVRDLREAVAEVERLRKVEAAARHLIDMIGRTGGVIPVESVENMVAALDAAQGGG